jgi:DNA processing protein
MERNMALAKPEHTTKTTGWQNAPAPMPSLAHEPLLDVLRLIRSENVGSVTFFQLMRRYGTAAKALSALPMLAARGGARRNVTICPVSKAEIEIEKTRLFGAEFIAYGHAHYPTLLMQIADPPPLLMVKGHPHLLSSRPLLAMVGSRNASAHGCQFARKIAKELGEAGYIVVSGLARGIDAYAHQGALETGTIGVIAGGIDHIYPPENAKLYESMRATGAVISEAPFGTAPLPRHFPARNRIIAGMSIGTLVVEATKKSGSLITADFAVDNGRDVFAVPGFPMDPRSVGTNHLIQQGAQLINCAADIVDSLRNRPYNLREHIPDFGLFREAALAVEEDENLDCERAVMLGLLSSNPVAIEESIVMSGVEARIVNVLLLELELAGMLDRHHGGRVSRKYEDE